MLKANISALFPSPTMLTHDQQSFIVGNATRWQIQTNGKSLNSIYNITQIHFKQSIQNLSKWRRPVK